MKPEDIRAIEFLDSMLENLQPEPTNMPAADTFVQGKCQMFTERIKARKIPADKFWRWNQTRAKKTATSPRHNAVISFVKLIPRKLRSDLSCVVPNYKLWQFEINYENGGCPRFVLWCEKGKTCDNTDLDVLFDVSDEDEIYTPKSFAHKISYICN